MPNALELLKDEVSKFKTSAVLKMISDITWKGPEAFGFRGDDSSLVKLQQFHLNLISKYAILHSDESTNKKSGASFDDIGRMLNIFHEHLTEPEFEIEKDARGKLTREIVYSFLRRTSQLQLRFQRDLHQELGRTLTVYNDLLKGDLLRTKPRRINYSQAFHELYGMNLERFLQLCYLIHGSYRAGFNRRSEIIKFCRTLPGFLPIEFTNTFNLLSIDKNKFASLAQKRAIHDPRFEYYDFNPLQAYPIYMLDEEEIIIPSYYEFIFRMVDGVYFDLFNRYADKNNIKANPFTEDLGEVFEEYVDTLWGITGKQWAKKFPYADGNEFSDYSVLEDSTVFLIELKAKRLRLPTRVKGQEQDLIDDLESGIIKGLIQIQNKIEDIKKRVRGLEKYYSVEQFYGIVLTMDKLYLGNSPPFRELVDAILRQNGINLDFEYQIMEANEFEDLIEPFRLGMSWTQLIERKMQTDVKQNPFKMLRTITSLYSTSDNQLLAQRFKIFNETIVNALSKIEIPGKQTILHLPPFSIK
jgi:hypothetical protein